MYGTPYRNMYGKMKVLVYDLYNNIIIRYLRLIREGAMDDTCDRSVSNG